MLGRQHRRTTVARFPVMSRYRKSGGKTKRQQDRPASVHRQQSSGRLSHWYSHKPIVTVDQLHKYRRKEWAACTAGTPQHQHQPPPPPPPLPPPPPISLSASPSFDTEYRCCFEPPYRTFEEMSSNRRHAAVPRDQLHVEGDAEFSAEYAEQYKDGPRARNIAVRQGSHIGPFVCADDAAPEAAAFRSEQNDQYVPHPDGRRADSLRPGTGLRLDESPMDGETEQTASYRKYPTTPHPDAAPDRNGVTSTTSATTTTTTTTTTTAEQESSGGLRCAGRGRTSPWPFDLSMREMVMTRDSGMLLGPARTFTFVGANIRRTERSASVKERPAFRMEVADCCGGGGGADDGRTATGGAFVVLGNPPPPPPQSPRRSQDVAATAVPVNGWTKRRLRKMGGGARFFGGCDARVRRPPAADAGKTLQ